jgi:hypothetical protein
MLSARSITALRKGPSVWSGTAVRRDGECMEYQMSTAHIPPRKSLLSHVSVRNRTSRLVPSVKNDRISPSFFSSPAEHARRRGAHKHDGSTYADPEVNVCTPARHHMACGYERRTTHTHTHTQTNTNTHTHTHTHTHTQAHAVGS